MTTQQAFPLPTSINGHRPLTHVMIKKDPGEIISIWVSYDDGTSYAFIGESDILLPEIYSDPCNGQEEKESQLPVIQ